MGKKTNGAAREAARRAKGPQKPPIRPSNVFPVIWDIMQSEGVSHDRAYEIYAAAQLTVEQPVSTAPVRNFSGTSRRDRRPADEVAAARLRSTVKSLAILRERVEREERHRDELVARLRSLGWSWDRVAVEVGVTRQALMKRAARTSS